METRIFKVDPKDPDNSVIKEAAKIISSGGLLAFPTETVYGLGANATDETAAKRIYEAKGRPADNPLIVHIADLDMLDYIATGDLTLALKLAGAFWPGPLTMVLPKSDAIPYQTTGGRDTVAVRMPSMVIAQHLIAECNCPVAAPSANASGRPSPTTAAHVINDLNGKIDGIIDSGSSIIGVESTVIDITTPVPRILRRGFIKPIDVEKAVGCKVDIETDTSVSLAPGMKYKHYSPNAKLCLVYGKSEDIFGYIKESGKISNNTAVICSNETKNSYKGITTYVLGSKSNGEEIMKNLYATLRKLDEDGVTEAFCEAFMDSEYSETIMERLEKACGGNTVKL